MPSADSSRAMVTPITSSKTPAILPDTKRHPSRKPLANEKPALGPFVVTPGSNTSSPLGRLAIELRLTIFEMVSQDGVVSDLFHAALVCRDWYKICIPILWTNIPVTNENIEPVSRSLNTVSQERCNSIRNLSIRLSPVHKKYCDPSSTYTLLGLSPIQVSPIEQSWTEIKNLIPEYELNIHDGNRRYDDYTCHLIIARLLDVIRRRLHRLQIFSLRSAEPSHNVFEQWQTGSLAHVHIPQSFLRFLLRALPPSCISLELDDGRPLSFLRGQHLCSTLREVIPRLYHLRLRVGQYCPCLFDPEFSVPEKNTNRQYHIPFSNIRSLSISFLVAIARFMGPAGEKLCAQYPRPSLLPLALPELHAHLWDANRLALIYQNRLAAHLRAVYEGGFFPNIEELSLVHRVHGTLRPRGEPFHFSHVDVLGKCVRIFPAVRLHYQKEGAPRNDWIPDWIDAFKLQSLHYSNNKKYIANECEILCALDKTWRTSSNGIRFPALAIKSKDMNTSGLKGLHPMFAMEDETSVLQRLLDFYQRSCADDPRVREAVQEVEDQIKLVMGMNIATQDYDGLVEDEREMHTF
ncbi:uncharacterized protein BDR25DRAFT_367473 [Lindgomyces ingoldianus]|uniref:Uncharacterized protein n=1 Tax=Lindgomyces ingoldianus TaxID=673940 RepID=A0ACB6R058_9PLEO|nr:uncharacterized protein BDR25DRAFT_367473 [Lindgomyces ingoldianus]KAF2471710.1 hypothetical protein BDR25DRAFT_367473 [Lindgomyces ingoldianus]